MKGAGISGPAPDICVLFFYAAYLVAEILSAGIISGYVLIETEAERPGIRSVFHLMGHPVVSHTAAIVMCGFTDRIEIGVFNIKAYNNLVAQVKACGFKLVADGYEAEYSNGAYDIFCYEGGKRVRIQKSATPSAPQE